MPSAKELAKVREGVKRGRKRAVEPCMVSPVATLRQRTSPALADEVDGLVGHVGRPFGRPDVGEAIALAFRRGQLPAEDAVLGQEHVLLEQRHAVEALLAEPVGERVIAGEVGPQRATLQRRETVGRECAGPVG